MKVKIKFISENKEFLEITPKPTIASSNKPEWLKRTESYVNNTKGIDFYGDPTSTIKKCMPVIDSINAGYHILTPCDIWVHNEGEHKIKFQWAYEDLQIITSQRSDQHATYPTLEGYHPTAFKFLNYWITKTPKNWSSLFIHPLHYEDLPFKTLSAIVDTDKYPTSVQFPFFLKKDFSGLIPQGTPIIQIIPFKRENFVASYSFDVDGKLSKIWKKVRLNFFDRYLKNFRSPKSYKIEDKKSKCPFNF